MAQFTPLASASAGPISEVVMTGLFDSGTLMVTAVRNGGGDLELICWNISEDSAGKQVGGNFIKRLGSVTGQPSSNIAVANVSPLSNASMIATAASDVNGNLRLNTWQVSTSSGAIEHLNTAAAGAATDIQLIFLNTPSFPNSGFPPELLLTTLRNGAGNLELIVWLVSGQTGAISRVSSIEAGAVSAVSSIWILDQTAQSQALEGGGSLVVTAVRNGSGDLELITWTIENSGATITHGTTMTAGAISEAAMAYAIQGTVTNSQNLFVTAVRNGSGKLELIEWSLPIVQGSDQVQASKLERLQSVTGVAMSGISVETATTSGSNTATVTAGIDANGKLRFDMWGPTAPGQAITNPASFTGAAIQAVALAVPFDPQTIDPSGCVYAALRDGNGNLSVATFTFS